MVQTSETMINLATIRLMLKSSHLLLMLLKNPLMPQNSTES